MSKFITHYEAIGRLVVAGLDVKFDVTGTNRTGLKGRIVHIGGRIYCFRDGTSWKVRADDVDDFIDAWKPVEVDADELLADLP